MEVRTTTWTSQGGWSAPLPTPDGRASLALLFAKPQLSRHPLQPIQDFANQWSGGALIGCSTNGHFLGESMSTAEIAVTIITFDSTQLRTATVDIAEAGGSRSAGRELGIKLAASETTRRPCRRRWNQLQ